MSKVGKPINIIPRNDGTQTFASTDTPLGSSLGGNTSTGSVPWKSLKKDSFFPAIDLDAKRWNRIYPYRFIVIDVTDNNKIVNGGETGSNVFFKEVDDGGVGFFFEPIGNPWVFQLPITPQQISVVDQFAISTSATMRGIVEEHNGIKFKIISASGTTGIWPIRDSLTDKGLNPSSLQSIFSGTIEAFGGIVKSVDRIKNTITTGNANNKPTAFDPMDYYTGHGTGYYQAQLLQQFLEQYAMAKKDPKNKGWRLVFDYPKENQAYVVTPMQYSVTKSQRSPGEHLWTMQLKAWKRINLKAPRPAALNLYPLDVNFFQRAVNGLNEARRLASNSLNLVKAVRSDFRKPFDALRQATLFIKDLGGVAFAASDLPNQIISDIQSSVLSYASDLGAAFGDKGFGGVSNNLKKFGQKAKSIFAGNEGLSLTAVSFGTIGNVAASYQLTDSINSIFQEPEGNFEIFNQISIDNLILAPDQVQAINDEIELTSLTSIEELREIRDTIQELMLDISNNFGAGDSDYSRIFGRPEPRERSLPMTPEEFEILTALENVILDLNIITSTRQLDDDRRQSSLEFVGGLADDAGIEFNSTSTSKYLAPVPYNLTIQEIAARYLKNPDRWIEISTLNNLRSPYIDEDGFFYNLLSNGDGRQFNISSNVNLYIGQKILLSSNSVNAFSRKIIDIQKITDSNFLITVDGLDDLDVLTIAAVAKIQAYLPGTVNSQNQIWIPTDEPSNQDPRFFEIPYLSGNTLTGLSKVDWLLDERGDIVINAFGDFRIANGLTNIIQALRMKVLTQKGRLLSFPGYGIGLTPGVISSELDVQSIFTDLQAMIQSDSRFETIENLSVTIVPPEVKIEMSVRLANGNGIFPINFTIKGQ